MPSSTVTDRAIRKLRAEMSKQHLSQRDLASLLGWSQSRVAKLLTRRVEMSLDDLSALCFAVNLNLVEAIRDDGYEFCAELSPTELRVLEAYRERPAPLRQAIVTILGLSVTIPATAPPKPPLTSTPRGRVGRPLNSAADKKRA